MDVDWLRGGAMAFRFEAIQQNPYYPDVFAMGQIRCGLGVDDTFVARWAGQYGRLLFASKAIFHHPNSDDSKAYPAQGYGLGYARAYSRRFLNDHYRILEAPHLVDRLALVRSYGANIILSWYKALISFRQYHYLYAWGYTRGAMRGLIQKPTSKNLTPNIDWMTDAEDALANLRHIR